MLREGLLDLLPQPEHTLAEMMEDGVLVLDWRGSVIFTNDAAQNDLALDAGTLASALGVATLADVPIESRAEARILGNRGERWLDLRVGPVFDRWGGLASRLVVVREVTAQKTLDAERMRLIAELQDALGKVSQLEGMLPICANCRKVRDDKGYWDRIEDYVGRVSSVEFTHGICPDCSDRLYPELSDGRTSERWKI